MKPYIVTLHETEQPAVKIYGPFDSETDAIAWGDLWQEANDDSPFWNLIEHDGMPIHPVDPVSIDDLESQVMFNNKVFTEKADFSENLNKLLKSLPKQ